MTKKIFSFAIAVAIAVIFTACTQNKPKNTFSSGITTVMCDESFENIFVDFWKLYDRMALVHKHEDERKYYGR